MAMKQTAMRSSGPEGLTKVVVCGRDLLWHYDWQELSRNVVLARSAQHKGGGCPHRSLVEERIKGSKWGRGKLEALLWGSQERQKRMGFPVVLGFWLLNLFQQSQVTDEAIHRDLWAE